MSGYVELQVTTNYSFLRGASDVEEMFVAAKALGYGAGNKGRGRPMQNQQGMTAGEWALLVLLSVLWGGSFFFAKVIVQELPPLTLVCIRFAIAAGALWAFLQASRTPVPRSLPAWAASAGMGALHNLIPAGLIAWSQQTIASGLASVLIATTPVFSILVGHGLTPDEKLSANKVAGVALGIAGTAALVGVDTLDGSGQALLATVGCLGAALSYGFANVFGRCFKRMGIVPAVGAFGQLAATAAMALPWRSLLISPGGSRSRMRRCARRWPALPCSRRPWPTPSSFGCSRAPGPRTCRSSRCSSRSARSCWGGSSLASTCPSRSGPG